jgi:putative Mg2+ transporter-C (MgtC) family protein
MNPQPDWIVWLQSFSWMDAVKVSLAALLGAIVGLERVAGGHPAGLRTNMVISISSCLFTLMSIQGFPLKGTSQDTSRVAAQIVTGVGFLGAGALLQSKGHVRGLTTAATIWLVSAIGMAVGTGAYFIAIFTTLLTTILLTLLAPISSHLERKARQRVKKLQAQQKEAGDEVEEGSHFVD